MYESMTSLIALALIIPLIILCTYLMKKWYKIQLKSTQDISVLEQLPLSSKERLLLIQVKQDVLLIGVTANTIATLHVLKKP